MASLSFGLRGIFDFTSEEQLQQYLKERCPFILTDDYVPVDNLIAPIFGERFGYQR